MSIIQAPWSAQQVEQLNRYQREGWFHPYTCGRRGFHDANLVATSGGWYCPVEGCDYTQDWALEGMASKEFLDSIEVSRALQAKGRKRRVREED